MPLTLNEWDARYREQARWTESLRAHLFLQAGIQPEARVLEVGCGTGVMLGTMQRSGFRSLLGLDLDPASLEFARGAGIRRPLICGNAEALPFKAGSLDAVFTHFLFLWLKNPDRAAEEIRRVLRPEGVVLSLAEPDYDSRITYPMELTGLGRAQRDSLARQGAEPGMGRRMAGLLSRHGFRIVETGILGGEWHQPISLREFESEWRILQSDLEGVISPEDLARLQEIDRAAARAGTRIWFIPTFFCLAVRH